MDYKDFIEVVRKKHPDASDIDIDEQRFVYLNTHKWSRNNHINYRGFRTMLRMWHPNTTEEDVINLREDSLYSSKYRDNEIDYDMFFNRYKQRFPEYSAEMIGKERKGSTHNPRNKHRILSNHSRANDEKLLVATILDKKIKEDRENSPLHF